MAVRNFIHKVTLAGTAAGRAAGSLNNEIENLMKRDMELVRKMLLEIESRDDVLLPSDDPSDYRLIAYHLLLLREGGLIAGIDEIERPSGELIVQVKAQPRLTWAGHEFVDAARSETLWKEATEKTGSALGTVSFVVLTQLLAQLAKQRLGVAQ